MTPVKPATSATSRPGPFARILCPTDFSDFSAAAVSYATALARTAGGAVHLLHVATPFPVSAPYSDLPGDPRLYEAQRAYAEEGLAAAAALVQAAGVPVTVEIRMGSPVHEVRSAAADWQADAIVLGTHGHSGFERLVLGSVTEKLLRTAPCAVLTVPHTAVGRGVEAIQWRRILCAHDGSAASKAGVDYAATLALRAAAQLTLVAVVETVPHDGDFTGPAFAAFREARQAHAEEALDTALPPETRARCRTEDRVVYGKPGEQILAVAQQLQPDLIVVGIQGRNALDLMIFGSTANHVVRQAEHPVLTVRPPAAGD